MSGTCKDCGHFNPPGDQGERIWNGGRCDAKEDGENKRGWGDLQYNEDGSIKRIPGTMVLDVKKCFYWIPKQEEKPEYEQLSLF